MSYILQDQLLNAIRKRVVVGGSGPTPSQPSLLLESGDHLLLETGDFLLLE